MKTFASCYWSHILEDLPGSIDDFKCCLGSVLIVLVFVRMAENAQPLVLPLDVLYRSRFVVDLKNFEGIEVEVSTAGPKQPVYLMLWGQHRVFLLDFFDLSFGVNNRINKTFRMFAGAIRTSFMASVKLDRPGPCELDPDDILSGRWMQ